MSSIQWTDVLFYPQINGNKEHHTILMGSFSIKKPLKDL